MVQDQRTTYVQNMTGDHHREPTAQTQKSLYLSDI
jgi:hypothetical protein